MFIPCCGKEEEGQDGEEEGEGYFSGEEWLHFFWSLLLFAVSRTGKGYLRRPRNWVWVSYLCFMDVGVGFLVLGCLMLSPGQAGGKTTQLEKGM